MSRNHKVKVLLSSPNEIDVGGISRWTGNVLRYYDSIKNNLDVDLVQYYKNGKSVYQNTNLLTRLCNGAIRYIPYLQELKRKLKEEKFEVVHFVSSASVSLIRDLLAVLLAKRKGCKTIIHFHFGRIPELYQNKNWEQKLLHLVICRVDKVIVMDKSSYTTLVNKGYVNVNIISNPLAPEIIEIIKSYNDIVRINNKVLFAGHHVPTKGVFELIKACSEIPDLKLKMIGHVSNEMKKKLIEEAGDNHYKWLEIAGEQDFETTIKEMLSASVFVLPTYTEGFPNVIIEAMACACPIVATNVGAIPEMLDIENGFNNGVTVEPKNVDDLKKAIISILNDREYAQKCGKNAQYRVNTFYSMSNIWNELVNIWTTINVKN